MKFKSLLNEGPSDQLASKMRELQSKAVNDYLDWVAEQLERLGLKDVDLPGPGQMSASLLPATKITHMYKGYFVRLTFNSVGTGFTATMTKTARIDRDSMMGVTPVIRNFYVYTKALDKIIKDHASN